MKSIKCLLGSLLLYILVLTNLNANPGLLIKEIAECDKILLVNGKEIDAKVLEVQQYEIVYRKCDNLKGPVYILDLAEVDKIRYSNGNEELIDYGSKFHEQKKKHFLLRFFGGLGLVFLVLIGTMVFFRLLL